MNYYEIIQRRESVRSYDPTRPVERAVLERILNAGRLAPSAVNKQPWTFNLIASREMLGKVRECYKRDWFHDAPHILVITGKKSEAWVRKYDNYCSVETDLTIAMDHIILAATAEGVGTCWIEAYKPDILREAMGLTEDQVVFSITPLGYPRPEYTPREKQRKELDEIVRWL